LKTFSVIPTHITNICDKFNEIPPVRKRASHEIGVEERKDKQPNGRPETWCLLLAAEA